MIRSILAIFLRPCDHEFYLGDLEKTGIEPPPTPTKGTVEEYMEFLKMLRHHESHSKRVKWPCAKCGKVFYAHCGLDISPKHGFIVSKKRGAIKPPCATCPRKPHGCLGRFGTACMQVMSQRKGK